MTFESRSSVLRPLSRRTGFRRPPSRSDALGRSAEEPGGSFLPAGVEGAAVWRTGPALSTGARAGVVRWDVGVSDPRGAVVEVARFVSAASLGGLWFGLAFLAAVFLAAVFFAAAFFGVALLAAAFRFTAFFFTLLDCGAFFTEVLFFLAGLFAFGAARGRVVAFVRAVAFFAVVFFRAAFAGAAFLAATFVFEAVFFACFADFFCEVAFFLAAVFFTGFFFATFFFTAVFFAVAFARAGVVRRVGAATVVRPARDADPVSGGASWARRGVWGALAMG